MLVYFYSAISEKCSQYNLNTNKCHVNIYSSYCNNYIYDRAKNEDHTMRRIKDILGTMSKDNRKVLIGQLGLTEEELDEHIKKEELLEQAQKMVINDPVINDDI